MGETAVQARYVVNSRRHSYYTFCCSVSPDARSLSLSLSLSLSHFPLLPTLFPFTSVCLLFLPIPHTHTHIRACMHVQSLTHTSSPLSLSLSLSLSVSLPEPQTPPPPPEKFSRNSKLSCITLDIPPLLPPFPPSFCQTVLIPGLHLTHAHTNTHTYTHTHTHTHSEGGEGGFKRKLLQGQRKTVLASPRRGVSRLLSV